MSFNPRSLAKIAAVPVGSTTGTSNLNQIFDMIYATDDTAATVEAAGYFNAIRGSLTIGSQISATMAVSSGTPVLKQYVVTAVPATGNVTIALQGTQAG